MRAGIGIGTGIVLLSIAGCAMDHLRTGDGGTVGDGIVTPECVAGEMSSTGRTCFEVTGNHICGDVATRPECIDGTWTCGPGRSSELASCWCWASSAPLGPDCVCTPAGWSCVGDAGAPDAGPPPIDAGATCPDDLSTIEGTPCANEGQSCGSCVNPCGGFCNSIQCLDHVWQRFEFGCADTTFACGPSLMCSRWAEYCQRTLSDVAGRPDDYRCARFPEECPDDCSCFPDAPGSDACIADGAGGLTLTLGGG